ncbi:hypothetical protein L1887_14508 [Cichorium endivia]|nr:hypothetical protein L1887_14508 [Cichorium endivia]
MTTHTYSLPLLQLKKPKATLAEAAAKINGSDLDVFLDDITVLTFIFGTESTVRGQPVAQIQTNKVFVFTAALSKQFKKDFLENFIVDNSTYTTAKIRATFYPKIENEMSDQEVRIRMIEMVSKGLATLEVSLKHSGSLFIYAGHEGGAYAKNSFGNVC